VTACATRVFDEAEAELGASIEELRRIDADGTPDCPEPGLYRIGKHELVACSVSGYARIDGIDGDAVVVELGTLDGHVLPPMMAVPSGGTTTIEGGTLQVSRADAVSVSEESTPPPSAQDLSAHCAALGVELDPATGDVWVCTETVTLLLPAVQSAREAATRNASDYPSFAMHPAPGHPLPEVTITSATAGEGTTTETPLGVLFEGTVGLMAKTKATIEPESL
jgi:hypothetical protein